MPLTPDQEQLEHSLRVGQMTTNIEQMRINIEQNRLNMKKLEQDLAMDKRRFLTQAIGGLSAAFAAGVAPRSSAAESIALLPLSTTRWARAERRVFVVQKPQGNGQHWRGKDHGMSHSSGPIEADLPHETA